MTDWRARKIAHLNFLSTGYLPNNHKILLYLFSQGPTVKGTGLFNEGKPFSTHLNGQTCGDIC